MHHQLGPAAGRAAGLAGRAPELTSGEGIFVEELRLELERRGIAFPRVAGMTHPLPTHDEASRAGGHCAAVLGGSMIDGDARGFRIALTDDVYVNPPPGGAGRAGRPGRGGWGVMALPATEYPAEMTGGSWPTWPSRCWSSTGTATPSC